MNLETRPIGAAPENNFSKGLSINNFISTFGDLGYRLLPEKDNPEAQRYRMHFVRNISNKKFPRFHMIIEISKDTLQPEITSFHRDIGEHKSETKIEMRIEEVKAILEKLNKLKQSSSRDEMIRLLNYELLTGDIRVVNGTFGTTQQKRLSRIIGSRKGPLKGEARRNWQERKSRTMTGRNGDFD